MAEGRTGFPFRRAKTEWFSGRLARPPDTARGLLNEEIDANLGDSDLCLFLISADFINSEYCFHKEYQEAVKRRAAGETEIVPIIIRACDWDVGGLRRFNALPRDGVPVTQDAHSKADKHQRDSAWLKIIDGIKTVLERASEPD